MPTGTMSFAIFRATRRDVHVTPRCEKMAMIDAFTAPGDVSGREPSSSLKNGHKKFCDEGRISGRVAIMTAPNRM